MSQSVSEACAAARACLVEPYRPGGEGLKALGAAALCAAAAVLMAGAVILGPGPGVLDPYAAGGGRAALLAETLRLMFWTSG